jgi:fluoroacetyl-CoA thioesterase
MVGLMEWACIEAIRPHLDWPREQSVGTLVNFTHLAATPPGLTVTVDVRLERIDGNRLAFFLVAHDGIDKIAEGTHQRVVIDAARFTARVLEKSSRATA